MKSSRSLRHDVSESAAVTRSAVKNILDFFICNQFCMVSIQ
jgi:hypothetical protein